MARSGACVAVGYMRVSANENGGELDTQRATIASWAVRHGIEMASWQADYGIAGVVPIAERPGLVAAYGAVRTHRAGVLVAARPDRFASDVLVATLVERAALEHGASLRTVEGNTVTAASAEHAPETDGDETWTRGALDLAAAYQSAMIRKRTREALAVKRTRGERIGTVPYGYQLAVDGIHLEPHVEEQMVLARVRALSASGLSQRAIVAELSASGVVGRTGSPLKQTQIARMLARAA